MIEQAKKYFENSVLPMIKNEYSHVYSKMSIMVLGSVGLDIDDEYSDFEAAIYLDDKLWKEYGKQLQLSLNYLLAETNQWNSEGSIICVHPVSWVLDGNANKILNNKDDIPWENISLETLFTVQHNFILADPKGLLKLLRKNTSNKNFPKHLWKKVLVKKLKQLILEDYFELNKCINRNHLAEANIIFGNIVEQVYHIAFLVSQHYYPWRTHLNWAFDQLSISKSELGTYVNSLSYIKDWNEKIDLINKIIVYYKEYINTNNLLPEIDLLATDLDNELLWAERLSAWDNPNWKCFIEQKKAIAVQNGYSSEQFWVWSLWA